MSHNLNQTAELSRGNPFQYDSVTLEKGFRPIGYRFFPEIVNIKAVFQGKEIVTTGEAFTVDLALAKAKSELLERTVLIARSKESTSNGWAAHPIIEEAEKNAILELIERDAVLSQWYSATPFVSIMASDLPSKVQEWAKLELAQSEFPRLVILLSTQGLGPSVTCILRNKNGFGVSAHSTRKTLEDSIESAIGEACRAAHSTLRREYWGDTLKLKNAVLGVVQPGAHSTYYAYHEAFPRWMFGEKISWETAKSLWIRKMKELEEAFPLFQTSKVMTGEVSVVFATHPKTFCLQWGVTNSVEILKADGAKRIRLLTVNKKAHIVA